MRALQLDYRREDRRARRAGVLVLVAGLAGAAALGVRYQEVADQLAGMQASMQASGIPARQPAAPAASDGDAPQIAAEYKHAGEVLVQLTRPWGALFASAESAATPDVALLSIESDVDKRRVNISGEAKNLQSVLEYLRLLSSRPALADVYLQSHALQKQDPQRPVRFVVSAQWTARQASPVEKQDE